MKLMACRRACRSPRLPSVIIFSASGRISFAFATVVSIFSFLSNAVTSILSNALRCPLFLPNCLPAHACLIIRSLSKEGLYFCGPLRQEPPGLGHDLVIHFHSQAQSHAAQDLFDLVERLPAEVLGLEHLAFGLLYHLRDGLNPGILEAVRRPY